MLDAYKELTRGKVMAKAVELQAWSERCAAQHALHVRWRRGLAWARAEVKARGTRVREVVWDAAERKRVADAEEERRKSVRAGGECARTRAGGVHRVGSLAWGALVQAQEQGGGGTQGGKRKVALGWEAGDAKVPRTRSKGAAVCISNGGAGASASLSHTGQGCQGGVSGGKRQAR